MTCKHALNPWPADQPIPACLNCEIEQLRATLSLAEEGLANYAQEIASLRNDLTACQLERDGMRAALEKIVKHRLRGRKTQGALLAEAALDSSREPQTPPHAEPWKCDWPGCTNKTPHGHAGLPPETI